MVFHSSGRSVNGGTVLGPTNGIASHFEALAHEQSKLEQNTQKTDSDRIRLEETIVQLRAQQKELSVKLRECQDSLGRYDRERSMLLQQKRRLEETLAKEHEILVQCASELDNLIAMEIQQKQKFCHDMRDLNQELSNLLMHQESIRMEKLVTGDTVGMLLQHYKVEIMSSPDSADRESLQSMVELEEIVDEFQKSESIIKEVVQTQQDLVKTIEIYRSQVIQAAVESGRTLSVNQVMEMENSWKESGQNGSISGNDDPNTAMFESSPMHMFYAASSSENNEMTQNDDSYEE